MMTHHLDDMRKWVQCEFRIGKWENPGKTNWLISSPFREDKHPSFSIDIEKRVCLDRATMESFLLSDFCKKLGIEEPGRESGRKREESILALPDARTTEATHLWERGKPAGDHPYLARKKIDGQGCRVDGNILLVPGYDIHENIVGVERIWQDGTKMHLGCKTGGFFPCGELDTGKPAFLCEGMATAKSVHAITGFPSLCTFGSINLLHVAQAIRGMAGEIMICPDADEAGRKSGEECRAGGYKVVEMLDGSLKGADWNDVVAEQGLEAAKVLFTEQLKLSQAEKIEVLKGTEKRSLRSFRQKIEPSRGEKPEMIGGIFPRGGVSVLAGQQGAGKSILMQKFCSDLSLGGEILAGVFDYAPAMKTVYFVGELPVNSMNDRQRTSEWAQGEENFILYSRLDLALREIPLDLNDGEGFKNIAEIVEDERPDLVVIDSMMSFLTCDESDMKAMQSAFAKLVRLADEMQCAIVVVHHIRKKKTLERAICLHMDDVIGSSIITRNASVALGVEKMKTNEGDEAIFVTNLKSWYAPLDKFSFQILQDGDKVFRGIEVNLYPENPVANKAEAIEHAVFKGHEDGSDFTVNGIAGLTGATDRYVRTLFRKWEELGRIVSKGGGKDTSYSIMRLFRNGRNSQCSSASASGTPVPDSSGKDNTPSFASGSAVPEVKSVIATAEAPFRNKPMIVPETFSSLAERADVSPEVVREELKKWETVGRVSLKSDGEILLLAGNAFPGEDGEPDDAETSKTDEASSARAEESVDWKSVMPDVAMAWIKEQSTEIQEAHRKRSVELEGATIDPLGRAARELYAARKK